MEGMKGMKSLIKNKPFVFGFVFGIFLMIIANIIDYFVAHDRYAKYGPTISHDTGPDWGVPFTIYGNLYFDFSLGNLVWDIITIILFSLIAGFIFKFVCSKIKARNLR